MRTPINLDDPHVRARIIEQSRLATACLVMVSLSVIMPDGHRIQAYAMPWQCFDTAAEFVAAGATDVTMFPGGPGGWMHWHKPARAARAARRRT